MVKALLWVMLRFLYQVRVRHAGRIPAGAAVLVPNHVSMIDAMLIAAHMKRPVHYAMHWKFYRAVKWFVAPMGAFPNRVTILSQLNEVMAVEVDINNDSHDAHARGGSLRQMLMEDLTAAQASNVSYRGLIRFLGASDPDTSELVDELLTVGESRAADLTAMLTSLAA